MERYTDINNVGAGYCNGEFQAITNTRTKVLNNWEIGRIGLATRSWDTPKGTNLKHI